MCDAGFVIETKFCSMSFKFLHFCSVVPALYCFVMVSELRWQNLDPRNCLVHPDSIRSHSI
jgi:hypothetical protein